MGLKGLKGLMGLKGLKGLMGLMGLMGLKGLTSFSIFILLPFLKARKNRITQNAWTVNAIELINRQLKNKFVFITSNEPELVFNQIQNQKFLLRN